MRPGKSNFSFICLLLSFHFHAPPRMQLNLAEIRCYLMRADVRYGRKHSVNRQPPTCLHCLLPYRPHGHVLRTHRLQLDARHGMVWHGSPPLLSHRGSRGYLCCLLRLHKLHAKISKALHEQRRHRLGSSTPSLTVVLQAGLPLRRCLDH